MRNKLAEKTTWDLANLGKTCGLRKKSVNLYLKLAYNSMC
jgi:hypothetical protein